MIPIAYSPRSAARAFDPPLSERLMRTMLREGVFRTVKIGKRIYILRSEIEQVLIELGGPKS
jgi:hypothetical protein